MDQSKQIAAGITFLIMCVVLLWLLLARMTWPPADWEDKPDTLEMAEPTDEIDDEEEYVEVKVEPEKTPEAQETTPTLNPVESDSESQPAPPSGLREENTGKTVDTPAKPTVSNRPSPAQIEKDSLERAKAAAIENQRKEEEEKAKQTAVTDVTNAFTTAENNGNTKKGDKDDGKSGKPSGEPTKTSQEGENFSADGTIGGGWKFPKYSDKIPSNEAGTAIFDIEVRKDGSVGEVKCTRNVGLSNRTIQNCIKEIKSRSFTNSNPPTAQSATAQLTITFI